MSAGLRTRPLDPLSSIKTKIGVVIVAAVGVTVFVSSAGHHFGISVFITAPAAVLAALAMVRVLSRGMTSPLREMAAAAAAMARGDYTRRVEATSRDEVGELARAFNAMAGELAETDRVRRDLVANVSHELRTPITALQAVLENVVDGVQEADPQTHATMLAQVERLGRLVAQLLDLSRLESGAVPLEKERFGVASLLAQTVREAELSWPDARMEVRVEPPELSCDGDAERIHQVVANLLENAVRHSPREGAILLSATQQRDVVRIEVSDDGPGIPSGARERVFERFYRADEARSSADGGTGLGLAIARWIVDLHGGQIRAEGRQPTGCRMVVELPGAGVLQTAAAAGWRGRERSSHGVRPGR